MSLRRRLASLKLVAAAIRLFSPVPQPEADRAEPGHPDSSVSDQRSSHQESSNDQIAATDRMPADDDGAKHVFRFHEDDACQIEILPIENWDHCQREFVAIDEHSRQHWDPGGAGWSKMYMRGPCPVQLSKLEITEEQFCEWLAPHSRRFDRVADPFEDIDLDEASRIRSVGFGPDEYYGVIADRANEDKYITSIWCKVTSDNDEIADMLFALGREHDLMLVDWLSGEAVDLRSRSAIEHYLNGD